MASLSTTALAHAKAVLKPSRTIYTRADHSRYMLRGDGSIQELPRLDLTPPAFPIDTPRWTAAMAASTPSDPTRLRLVTWNMWFDHRDQAQRFDALMVEVLALNPDVVCLQEVTPQVLSAIEASALLQTTYEHSPEPVYPYGCLILARRTLHPTFANTPLPSKMGRSMVTCVVEGHMGALPGVVGTVHLESLNAPAVRAAQLRACAAALAPHANAVLCGDFNFDDTQAWGDWHRKECDRIRPLENDVLGIALPEFEDVWPLLYPGVRGATFDGAHNSVCIADRHEVMRYDRVLIKRGQWHVTSIALLGKQALDATGIKISDHYGLVVDCNVVDPRCAIDATEL